MNYKVVSAARWYNTLSPSMKAFIFKKNGWNESYRPSGSDVIKDFEEFYNNGGEFRIRVQVLIDDKTVFDKLMFFKTSEGVTNFINGFISASMLLGPRKVDATYKVVGYGMNSIKTIS